jgi:predicted GNAT family N-acyltransferase
MKDAPAYLVEARTPSRLSLKELAICAAIVKRGDAVDPDSAQSELPLAEVLAVASTGKEIVGVGAIKRSRREYALQIAESSGFSFSQDTQELGYVAVESGHRRQGLSGRILAELLSRHERSLFATTSDERMKKTLAKAGFEQKGLEWNGRKGQQLSLWIKSQGIAPSQR